MVLCGVVCVCFLLEFWLLRVSVVLSCSCEWLGLWWERWFVVFLVYSVWVKFLVRIDVV